VELRGGPQDRKFDDDCRLTSAEAVGTQVLLQAEKLLTIVFVDGDFFDVPHST
jgi:hypothetical protein